MIGSTLHELAFPDDYEKHVERGRELEHAHEHPGNDIGEQLLPAVQQAGDPAACRPAASTSTPPAARAACGSSTSPSSTTRGSPSGSPPRRCRRSGQQFYVPTKYATAVAAPTTIAPDPTRNAAPGEPASSRSTPLYGYIYVADKYEGLILVGAGTLLDGNPLNNFLKRELTFNPDGMLDGARSDHDRRHLRLHLLRRRAWWSSSLDDPKQPAGDGGHRRATFCSSPTAVQVQFRYAFVVRRGRAEGARRDRPGAARGRWPRCRCADVHSIYLARTYAYVAGRQAGAGDPRHRRTRSSRMIDQVYNAGGCINDLHDVKLGITYTSEFAYLADGKNGLRVVQLTSPETPGNTASARGRRRS